MSYGIQIFNGNGDLQLSTESPNRGFIVTDAGTATATPNKINLQDEFLFCRPASYNTTTYMFAKLGAVDSNGKRTVSFRNSFDNALSCDYIIAKVASEFTASSSGHGVQIFNSAGDLSFDSGLYDGDGGIGITDYLGARQGTGNFDLLDTDRSKYAFMNGSTFTQNSFEIGFYYGTNLQVTGIFYFGELTINSRFEDDVFGGGGISTFSITNFGAIFLAEGGSV